MHRILFGAYRDWTIDVRRYVEAHPRVSSLDWVTDNAHLAEMVARNRKEYDFTLLCGWSGQPYKSVIDSIPVFSEHPSPVDLQQVDKYSLGTPLQHMISDGYLTAKHRLVKLGYPEQVHRQFSHEVDMSLNGGMDDVLDQMRTTSKALFDRFLNDYPNVTWTQWPAWPTNQMHVPRVPGDSKLSRDQLANLTVRQLYDFCRMLENPYPRAYIEDADGMLTFEKVSYKAKR
jgi:hypothetical protein